MYWFLAEGCRNYKSQEAGTLPETPENIVKFVTGKHH